jgi:hypothetical protein
VLTGWAHSREPDISTDHDLIVLCAWFLLRCGCTYLPPGLTTTGACSVDEIHNIFLLTHMNVKRVLFLGKELVFSQHIGNPLVSLHMKFGARLHLHNIYGIFSWTNKKLSGLSPRANYTDQATAACRRSYWQLLRAEGVTWPARRIPLAVFSILDRSRYFFFSSSSSIILTRLSGPRSRPTTSEKIW